MNEKIKDLLIRAGKTFWQAMLATIVVSIPEIVELIPEGWNALIPVLASAGIGAVAAGLSAAYNGVLAPFIKKLKDKYGSKVIILSERDDNSIDKSK